MAFYRKRKQLSSNKWYPQSITMGQPADTDEVARRLSEISTVSPADAYAVLVSLGEVLGDIMSEGRSVQLKGVGSFYYTCRAVGNGVDTPEEVNSSQITNVQVRFIPEYERGQQGNVKRRTLVKPVIHWIDVDKVVEK